MSIAEQKIQKNHYENEKICENAQHMKIAQSYEQNRTITPSSRTIQWPLFWLFCMRVIKKRLSSENGMEWDTANAWAKFRWIEEGYAIIRANDQKLNKTDDIFNNSKLHVSSAFIWHDVCLQSEIYEHRVDVIPWRMW